MSLSVGALAVRRVAGVAPAAAAAPAASSLVAEFTRSTDEELEEGYLGMCIVGTPPVPRSTGDFYISALIIARRIQRHLP